jgi:hypothetical protein
MSRMGKILIRNERKKENNKMIRVGLATTNCKICFYYLEGENV